MTADRPPDRVRARAAEVAAAAVTEPAVTPEVAPAALRRRSVRGAAGVLGGQLGQLVIGLGTTAVLARLVLPHDYGLFFMVVSVTAFLSTIRDFGYPMAVVAAPELHRPALTALFWHNARLVGTLQLVLLAAGPVTAWFYGEPLVTFLLWTVASAQFLDGLTSVHLGLVRRDLRFGALAGLDLGATVTAAAAGIVAAVLGAGPWALVAQLSTYHLGHGAGVLAAARWRPGRPERDRATRAARLAEIGAVRRYGRDVTWSRAWGYLGRNVDRFVVGRVAGPAALGLYANSWRWATAPVNALHPPLLPVVISTLSRLLDDPPAFRRAFRSAARLLSLALIPALAFAGFEATAVIRVLLGPRWLAAVPLFRVLVVGAAATAVLSALKWVNYAEGQPRRQLHISVATVPLAGAGVLIGAGGGAQGVAIGFTVATAATAPVAVWWSLRGSRIGARDLWAATGRAVAAAVLGIAALALADPVLPAAAAGWGRLFGGLAVFLLAGSLAYLTTPSGRAELRGMAAVARSVRGR